MLREFLGPAFLSLGIGFPTWDLLTEGALLRPGIGRECSEG